MDIHPGLVVILPSIRRVDQIDLFEAVIRRLEEEPDTVNKLVEIDEAGAISIQDFPPPQRNIP